MSKILKNVTNANIMITDCGTTINANSQYTIYPQEYPLFASSSSVITLIGDGDIVVNDGNIDLSVNEGTHLIVGSFPQRIETYMAEAANDAFGRARVSTPHTIFEASFALSKKPLLFAEKVVGTGSISYDSNQRCILLSVAANGDRAVRQTKSYMHYIAGHSMIIKQTATLDVGEAGLIQRLGYFSDSDGLFFQQSNTSLSVTVRNSSSGSIVDTNYPRNTWDDPLDGTGASGVTLDTTMDNIYVIDFQWLGAGRVRFGFGLNGSVVYFKTIDHANTLPHSYMAQGNLPIRQEILSMATLSGAKILESFCVAADTEGNAVIETTTSAIDTGTPRLIQDNAFAPVIALRLKSAFNRGTIIPNRFFNIITTNDDAIIRVLYNPSITVSGVWTSSGDESIAEHHTNITAISGGHVINADVISKSGGTVSNIDHNLLRLGSDIDGVSDIIVIIARSLQSSAFILSGIQFEELY